MFCAIVVDKQIMYCDNHMSIGCKHVDCCIMGKRQVETRFSYTAHQITLTINIMRHVIQHQIDGNDRSILCLRSWP